MKAQENVSYQTADADLLKESGVHKLVITDADGRCLAYLLAWASFGYDPQIDAYVCVVDSDDSELMTLFTEGTVTQIPGTKRYSVTAPSAPMAPQKCSLPVGVVELGRQASRLTSFSNGHRKNH